MSIEFSVNKSQITKGVEFSLGPGPHPLAMPNPQPSGGIDDYISTYNDHTQQGNTNNPVRMVYTLPPYSRELESDLHASFIFGFKEAPTSNAVVTNVNSINQMVSNSVNSKLRRSKKNVRTLETNLMMNLPLVNMFLHARTLAKYNPNNEKPGPLTLAEIKDLIQPVGVGITQNNANQSVTLNGLPGVITVMHQGLTDTFNIWGNQMTIDADLYFIIVPEPYTGGSQTLYSVTDDHSSVIPLSNMGGKGYGWRIKPYYTTNGKPPDMTVYSREIDGIYVLGGFWRVGRFHDKTQNFFSKTGEEINTRGFETNDRACKLRHTIEIMLDPLNLDYV